jgi:hypothetical protein
MIVTREKAAAFFEASGRAIPLELVEDMKARLRWDRERRQLWYGEILCRKYGREAPIQFELLDAFQEAGWPQTIDSPFPQNESKLRETIRDLNRRLSHQSPIRFRGSVKPEWYFSSSPTNSH